MGCGLTLLGDDRLAISVTYLPGIDTLGEEVAPRGPVPDVVLARGGAVGEAFSRVVAADHFMVLLPTARE